MPISVVHWCQSTTACHNVVDCFQGYAAHANKKYLFIYCFLYSCFSVTVRLRDAARVPAGATPIFVCTPTDPNSNNQPVITKWTKGPALTLSDNDKRYHVYNKNRNLAIFSITKSGEGWYYCHARTTSGQTISGKAYIYVIGVFTLISIHYLI